MGCRVSVLVENKAWHEGVVADYSRIDGMHCVDFTLLAEQVPARVSVLFIGVSLHRLNPLLIPTFLLEIHLAF